MTKSELEEKVLDLETRVKLLEMVIGKNWQPIAPYSQPGQFPPFPSGPMCQDPNITNC